MLAGVPTHLSISGAMKARMLWIQTRDSVLELFSTSIKEAIYEQHRVHRRLGCHCYSSLVIFWFALGRRLSVIFIELVLRQGSMHR
jgi:hypothetical protein